MFDIIYQDGYIGSRMHFLPAAIVDGLREDPFTSQLHVVGIGHYPHSLYHYKDRPQGCGEYILIYCVDGKGYIQYRGQVHELGSGNFFILPPGCPHTYWADESDPWSIYWIHFEGSNAEFISGGFDRLNTIPFEDGSRISGRIELFEELYNLVEIGYSRSGMQYATAVLTHFLGTFRYVHDFRVSSANRDDDTMGFLNRSRHYMIENMERQITMTDLCEYLGYSQSRCTTLFKEQTGMSPMQYLNNMRIQQAVRLLSDTNLKINQICQKVGISDPYYFSRAFSKALRCPPSEYRKKAQSPKERR